MSRLTVFYNGRCSICAPEVAVYQRMAEAHNIKSLVFENIFTTNLPEGYDQETLLKRIHAKRGDQMLVGAEAFIAMWAELPKFKYLAYAINWPIMRGMTGLIYTHLIAPWLYRRYVRAQCEV